MTKEAEEFLTQEKIDHLQSEADDDNGIIPEESIIKLMQEYANEVNAPLPTKLNITGTLEQAKDFLLSRYMGVKDGEFIDDYLTLNQVVSLMVLYSNEVKQEQPTENVSNALNHTVSAIYFNDNSDYLTELYGVVRSLTGLKEPSEEDIKKLFKELNK